MFKFLTIFLAATALFLPIFLLAQAQEGDVEIMLSWNTDSLSSNDYAGKLLPAPGSSVRVALQLLENNIPVSVAKNEISWFIDNNLTAKGTGLDRISFNTNGLSSNSLQNIKVFINRYKGVDYQRTINIPIVRSEAVIKYPYNELSVGPNKFSALLFNWNIKRIEDLLIKWAFGNNNLTGDRNIEAEIPATYKNNSISVNLNVKNPINDLVFADTAINLLVK